jgi:hypothetical protein
MVSSCPRVPMHLHCVGGQSLASMGHDWDEGHSECATLICSHFAAMSPTEVTEKLGLLRMKERSWYCHPSNALAGDGLFEGEFSTSDLAPPRLTSRPPQD